MGGTYGIYTSKGAPGDLISEKCKDTGPPRTECIPSIGSRLLRILFFALVADMWVESLSKQWYVLEGVAISRDGCYRLLRWCD